MKCNGVKTWRPENERKRKTTKLKGKAASGGKSKSAKSEMSRENMNYIKYSILK